MTENLTDLRIALFNFLKKNGISNSDPVHKIMHEHVVKRIGNILELEKSERDKIIKGFVCEDFQDYLREGVNYGDKKAYNLFLKKCEIAGRKTVINFLEYESDIRSKTKDIFAIYLGYDGYLKFCDAIMAKKTTSYPTHLAEKLLDVFFKNSCYLFAYNEEIAKPKQETSYSKSLTPDIDAIVLTVDTKTKTAFLNNEISGKKRTNHKVGILTWAADKKAFDIIFNESPRKLILRCQIPQLSLKPESLELLLGYFSYVDEDNARIVWGTIVLKKNNNNIITPFCYNVKVKGEETLIPSEILDYLIDRYKNIGRLPGDDIIDLISLRQWLDIKFNYDYTRKKIPKIEYLLLYPITSYGKKHINEKNKINNKLKKLFLDFKNDPSLFENQENFIGLKNPKNTINELSKYLKENFEQRKIFLFPTHKETPEVDELEELNKYIFNQINTSNSVAFIIPGFDDNGEKITYEKISSIYTIIGYCLALKKKTFIFYQVEEHLPLIVRTNIKELKLRVFKYKNIGEIPFHYHFGYFLPKKT